jgi:uncharacterized protein YndB with AHSA1/START domain
MSSANETGRILRLERFIPSPPDDLFTLWIEPEQITRWWAPDGYKATVHDLDVRPGGRWRIVLRGSGGRELAMGGFYHIVEPPQRLTFSWAWEEETGTRGSETEVTVSFEPVLGGTRLVLVHQSFDSKDARDRHSAGWSASFDRLTDLSKEPHSR